MNQRKTWIDILRAFAIIMVVYGHLGQSLNLYFVLTSAIKMPLFYALSGYLFINSRDIKIKSLINRMIVPWLLLSITPYYSIYKLFCGEYSLAMSSIINYLTHWWFIPSFFITSVIFRIIITKSKNTYLATFIIIIICILGFFVPNRNLWGDLCIKTTLITPIFMMMGYLWRLYTNKYSESNKYLFMGSGLIYIIAIIVGYLIYPGRSMDIHLSQYYNIPLCFIQIITGLVFTYLVVKYSISKIEEKRKKKNNLVIKLFSLVGKHSLTIYLLHGVVYNVLIHLCSHFYPHNNSIAINVLIYTIVTVIICTMTSCVLERYFPFVIGIKRKNKIIK